jgi:adenylate cyclase
MYEQFLRRCVRNLLVGTALSTVPAAAFYFFVFPYTERQLMVLLLLGVIDLLAFLPLDIAILRWSLQPVGRALAPDAGRKERQGGMARLLDSPLIVIARVYGPHAISASAGITILVVLANRYLDLGIEPATFPLYWVLNLTVIPVAHVVYEFAAMERAIQPLAQELAKSVRASEAPARRFTLEQRMRIFFPLLALAPIAVVSVSIFLRINWGAGSDPSRLVRDLVAIGGACAVLFLYLMYTLGGQVRTQTQQLIASLDRLGRGDMAARAGLYSTSEFGEIAAHVDDMALSLSERQRLRDLFGAYMTDEVATALLARGDHEADRTEKRYVAVLFVDVRGFTAFSRERAPETVVEVLNRFFEAAVGAVAAHRGTVNKYLGDGLLAIFGAPVGLENPCASAIGAAVEMTKRVADVNRALAAEGVPEMRVGIGIHAGEVVVGSIGAAKHKLEYTVIGDPVNVAARIEQLNKPLGTEILVSEEALMAAGEAWRVYAGTPASEQVKGIEKPVTVYPIGGAAIEARGRA